MKARTHEAISTQPEQTLTSAQKHKLGQTALSATDQTPAQSETDHSSNSIEQSSTPADILEDITLWRTHYDHEERDFAEYAKTHPNTTTISYRNHLKYAEHDAASAWQSMQASTEKAIQQRAISSDMYALAEAQSYGEGIEPDKTIEAASSMFYHDRIHAIRSAIDQNPHLDDATRHHQTSLLTDTWPIVYKYIQSTEDTYSSDSGQNYRNQCHNDMIKQLNQLNDLARSYKLTPPTFRNFMPNDVTYGYRRDRDTRLALEHKANYDRETVASYFHQVFAKEITQEENARNARERLFR